MRSQTVQDPVHLKGKLIDLDLFTTDCHDSGTLTDLQMEDTRSWLAHGADHHAVGSFESEGATKSYSYPSYAIEIRGLATVSLGVSTKVPPALDATPAGSSGCQ